MIILSKYTETGDYPELARVLRASCEKWGLRASIGPVPDESSWAANVHNKPRWILEALMTHREQVLWLDADCEVVRLPGLLLGVPADFACYNWFADAENTGAYPYNPDRLMCSGGTLLFGYTAPAIELLLRWIDALLRRQTKGPTDPVLDMAYNTHRPPVHPLWLPKSYNRHDSYWPNVQPVINHVYREKKHAPASMSMFHYANVYDEMVESVMDGCAARFVEIGCWLGDSSSHMAKAIRDSGKDIDFYCVDTWKGSEGVPWMQGIVERAGGDLYPLWETRMRTEGLFEFTRPMRMPSLKAAESFEDGSVDFVFVDGDHSYEAVKADIDAWLPKVTLGGLLAGDDYDRNSHPGVPQAVDEVFGKQAVIQGRSWLYTKEAA